MCHFVTAVLPKDVELKQAKEIFKRHHLGFREIENDSVREHLEKGDIYVLTTRGMCDCGTVLASQSPEPEEFDEAKIQKHEDQAVEKLKAKGWSDAKIRRWQREIELNRQKNAGSQNDALHESARSEAENWTSFIENILDSKAAGRIGILVHEYRGGLENRLKINGKQTVSRKSLSPQFLAQMNEDVIYDFVP